MSQFETEPPKGTKGRTAHVLIDGDGVPKFVGIWTDGARWVLTGEKGSWSPYEVYDKGCYYSHPLSLSMPEPPNPYAPMRDAVVEAAIKAWERRRDSDSYSQYVQARDDLWGAVEKFMVNS